MARDLTSTLLLVVVGLALLLAPPCAGHVTSKPLLWSFQGIDVRGSDDSRAFSPLEIPLPDGVTGAESLAFDGRGQGPYAGVSDGRVLKWRGRVLGWTTFAYSANYRKTPICTASTERTNETEAICGRPLGLQFHAATGDLYIADAYLGLLRVGPAGGEAEVLATAPDGGAGAPFRFVNGLDVDQATGDVYFTDSSLKYQRWNNFQVLLHRDGTGRLLKYDARTKKATVLKANLHYPNGVALSSDLTHVVVAHTGPCQAFRYWIAGPKAGRYELLADLPGYADNVRRDARGGYWFALNREKIQFNATTAAAAAAPAAKHLVGVRVDSNGKAIEEMTAPEGVTLSEAAERGGLLWLGSVELDYVGLVDLRLLRN